MAAGENTTKDQFSVLLDNEDRKELDELAKARRTSVAQLVREYIAVGLERDKRIGRIAQAVEGVA